MKRDETLCLRSLWAFGTEGNHLTPREAELGLLKVGKYALRSGGLSSPNSVRVQICTRTDSEVYESEMCTRTYLYAYRSGQRSTNSDGSQQVFSQRPSFEEKRTRTDLYAYKSLDNKSGYNNYKKNGFTDN